jgi:hypothetical protein
VQLGDVADVLQEEVVDAVVVQHKLIELRHHPLQLVVSAYPLEQSRHRNHNIILSPLIRNFQTNTLAPPLPSHLVPIL